ncbi:MAG TPA: pyruvate carboxylase subunit B, partial [Methanocorpusculum sp.]|nr:pyruvate carboxylase subunit B [Methanocorpusculum sp.]
AKYNSIINPISLNIDSDVLVYQLPGGMISNLLSLLKDQNALDKLPDVLKEVPNVRKDLGYPPLVTPTSQIVGTQAVLNVMMGSRYKTITNEVKDYLKGMYGKPPAPLDKEFVKSIIGSDQIIKCRPADIIEPQYTKMSIEAKNQNLIKKEEDILTYILYPAIAPAFLKGEAQNIQPITQTNNNITQKPTNSVADVPSTMEVEVDGEVFNVRILSVDGESVTTATEASDSHHTPHGNIPGGVKSSIQGMVLDIKVKIGQIVSKGDTLVLLEAMKMENPVVSSIDGTVTDIFVSNGDIIQSGDVLMVVK